MNQIAPPPRDTPVSSHCAWNISLVFYFRLMKPSCSAPDVSLLGLPPTQPVHVSLSVAPACRSSQIQVTHPCLSRLSSWCPHGPRWPIRPFPRRLFLHFTVTWPPRHLLLPLSYPAQKSLPRSIPGPCHIV